MSHHEALWCKAVASILLFSLHLLSQTQLLATKAE